MESPLRTRVEGPLLWMLLSIQCEDSLAALEHTIFLLNLVKRLFEGSGCIWAFLQSCLLQHRAN